MFSNRKRFFFLILHVIFGYKNSFAYKNFGNREESKFGQNVTRRQIGYFWHVSDVFFDPTYSPLGAPENDCHIENSVNFTRNCGFFGELEQCSAFGLVETIARTMNSTRWNVGGSDFCIFTGNLRCPNIGEDQSEAIYDTMSAFIKDIQNAGFVNVYPSYGWYDYHPHGHHPLKLTSLYDRVKNLLRHEDDGPSILGDQLIPKTGYFSHVESSQNRIRIIVMNTNFYVKNHIASRLPDPAGQWGWLVDQLRGCRMAVQKVFIVMSVPPGVGRMMLGEGEKNYGDNLVWRNRHNLRYLRIVEKFHDVIAAQFAGHRHEDTFRLVYNREGKAVSSILLAPAINPSFGNYPAMRIYMYDKNSGELIDFVQYYFNLTKANLEADMISPQKYWEIGYSFRDSYRLKDAAVSSLENLVNSFKKNEAMFERYHINAEGLSTRRSTCENRCRVYSICAIKSIDSGSFFECLSGELMENEGRIIRSHKSGTESLRDRLVIRRNNFSSTSPSAVAASTNLNNLIIVGVFCLTIANLRYNS